MIKCVVWDIDNTLLAGTWLESADFLPPPDPALLTVARELDGRGIVHALASRNPPAAAAYVAEATGLPFAAAECGWGRKSDALRRIMDDLGLAPDAVAFVDDDLMERAEVSAGLPGVLVLSPEDAAEAPAWPEFRPAVLTAEGRRRGEMYAERRRRQDAARSWGGSRDDFLRSVGTQVEIAPATAGDVPRLHELSVRTHQFNTAGTPASPEDLAAWAGPAGPADSQRPADSPFPAGPDGPAGPSDGSVASVGSVGVPGPAGRGPGRHQVITARLRDSFGDDGLVGGAVLATGDGPWTVSLLMMSCRALGRGVLDALLAALLTRAAAAGAAELRIPCLMTDRNVPLRLALTAAGFRAGEPAKPTGQSRSLAEPAVFAHDLTGPLPALPDWAKVTDGTADEADEAADDRAIRS